MENDKKRFYPDYLSEVLLVVFLTIELLLALALLFPRRIGRPIDFTSPYQPMPEWYFLWLYQLVRYFPGSWAFIGTVVLPLAAVLLLLYLPWLDRGGRKALLVALLLLAAFLTLTAIPLIRSFTG